MHGRRTTTLVAGAVVALALAGLKPLQGQPVPGPKPAYASQQEADLKNPGCLHCHNQSDNKSMHSAKSEVVLACVDCHGGNGQTRDKDKGHVQPKNRDVFRTPANPERSYAALLEEDLEYVRFLNPGDLRAAPLACGPCHRSIVQRVSKNLMTTGAMLYGAALYNNGVVPLKNAVFGESYDPVTGAPRKVNTVPPPTPEDTKDKGVLPTLYPLPRWELGQTGNPFRVFERGGRRRLEVGLPDVAEDPGKPDKGLSPRGPGTLNRIDPIILGAQKTRLLDPMLSFLGTNDHPGDYRSSGCSACHVVYANDRDPANSGPYAVHGNRGQTQTADTTIPRGRSGHPIKHAFTTSIPSSQCMTCHMHPGTNMVATYLGATWWDNEVDGQAMYPQQPKTLSAAQRDAIEEANPEGAALRGNWSDPDFLAEVSKLNPQLKNTQFADFHGHGWVFRNVYKKDRKGQMLDAADAPVKDDDPQKFAKAVHLKDIHLERGMHCVDCHFKQDNHGDGKLYGEPRPAIEIDCIDCHGTESAAATLVTSGPASTGTKLDLLETPFETPRFERKEGKVLQRSVVEKDKVWTIPQTMDGKTVAAQKSHTDAHPNAKMTCYACHSAWTTSCFGCHLSMKANQKKPNLHNEGGDSRNWTSYNFQTLRDDAYFLARDGHVGPKQKDEEGKPVRGRIAPARSACAILVSSQNQNREWIYSQQQTVSGGGFAGTAFSTYVPHTVRTRETKLCTDCHLSKSGDNNAWMASLLLQGTGLMNFIGRYAYVGTGQAGFEAVVVTERDEPQAVIGSRLHELAYPEEYRKHVQGGQKLHESYHHGGHVLSLQLRGEYLFAAQGKDGLRIYDVAQIDHKGFSERMVSSPVSPLGQKLYVDTKDATSVALPANMTIDPSRPQMPDNMEQPVHPLYAYAFVTDREEGLVAVGPLSTLLDGDPRNNFVKRAQFRVNGQSQPAWTADGALVGATSMTFAGTTAYVTTPRGVVVLDLSNTRLDGTIEPRVLAQVSGLREPRAVAVQLRYAFVTDADGLKVLDVSNPAEPKLLPGVAPLAEAHGLYLARTYAYVAAGRQGLAIVDIEKPEQLGADKVSLYDAGGAINDAHDVKLGMTNGSAFAYVADGHNGLRVVQVISANETPGAYGFSPKPTPKLIASYHTHGPALALSRGLDRDRAVDETGNQLGVFGRRGARPLGAEDVKKILAVKPVSDPARN